jgi:hypothetical protein
MNPEILDKISKITQIKYVTYLNCGENIPVLPGSVVINTNISGENLRKTAMLFMNYHSKDRNLENELVMCSYNTIESFNSKNYFNIGRLVEDIEKYNKTFSSIKDIRGLYKTEQLEDEEVLKYMLELTHKRGMISRRSLENLIKKLNKDKNFVKKIVENLSPELLFPELVDNLGNYLEKYNKKLIFINYREEPDKVMEFIKYLKDEGREIESLKIYALNPDGEFTHRELLRKKPNKLLKTLRGVIQNSLFYYFNITGLALYSLYRIKNEGQSYYLITPKVMVDFDNIRRSNLEILKNLKLFNVERLYIEDNIDYNSDDPSYLDLIL